MSDDLETTCAEAARLVMGWKAVEVPWAYDGVTPVWHTPEGEPVMTVFSWQPDRSDVHSAQVLDRMLDLGFELTLTARGEGTTVRFSRGAGRVACGRDRDRRIAVLRAALAAMDDAVES